jgi:putative DNA-invertase from lambdoid prophage Rac
MTDYKGALAATYSRVSTSDQENSVHMQGRKIFEYATLKNLELLEEYLFVDTDTSGTIDISKRESGSKLLKVLEAGTVKHLIVNKLDRLGRKAIDIQATWRALTDMGVTIHVLDLGGNQFSSDSPITTFIVGVLSLCAEIEVERIRERIKSVLDDKKSQGDVVGRIPFGFTSVGSGRMTTKDGVSKEIMKMLPYEPEQAWIRKMLEWRAFGSDGRPGKWTYQQIAEELNRLGVKTKLSGTTNKHRLINGVWNPGTVYKLLKLDYVKDIIKQFEQEISSKDSKSTDSATEGERYLDLGGEIQDCDGERVSSDGGSIDENEGGDRDRVPW